MGRTTWTPEQVKYLKQNWGRLSLKQLAKKLNKTEIAVNIKAKRNKFTRRTNPAKFTLNEIAKTLNIDRHAVSWWKDEKGLITTRAVTEAQIFEVTPDELKRFLKENPDLWDSRRTPNLWRALREKRWIEQERSWRRQNSFGKRKFPKHLSQYFVDFVVKVAEEYSSRIKEARQEPDWLREKRELDKPVAENRFAKWKPEEDRKLVKTLKIPGMTYKKAGLILGRSENAVERRIKRIYGTSKLTG